MKRLSFLILFVLLMLANVYSQTNCSKEQKQRAKEIVEKITTPNYLKFEIEKELFGDCIHHQWMDTMQKLDIKQVVAVVAFTWSDGLKKFKINKITFAKDYFSTPIKDKKILKSIKESGLKEEMSKAFADRTNLIISAFKNELIKKNSNKIKGILYLSLLDNETLPLMLTTSDIEIF